MVEEKTYGNIYITNEMLDKALRRILGESHYNEGVKMVLHGLLQESHKGAEWFMKFAMGADIPNVPMKGSEVYVSLNRLSYTVDEKLYENSPYNENGFIKCVVTGFSGFHTYSPIKVELPNLDPSNKSDKKIVSIDFNEWKYADDDFYDRDRIPEIMPVLSSISGSGAF